MICVELSVHLWYRPTVLCCSTPCWLLLCSIIEIYVWTVYEQAYYVVWNIPFNMCISIMTMRIWILDIATTRMLYI